ncbi:hypothetical protein NPIL_281191 [Nephila pilipes]|uniref:Uncharacterized protein n=1 Tax=Nephila pilipes TaxID=299642 RepID=A0A8X6II28_NEPPI|nr:hypothetical protein NPIL_281191 [Nephila pilipes]
MSGFCLNKSIFSDKKYVPEFVFYIVMFAFCPSDGSRPLLGITGEHTERADIPWKGKKAPPRDRQIASGDNYPH